MKRLGSLLIFLSAAGVSLPLFAHGRYFRGFGGGCGLGFFPGSGILFSVLILGLVGFSVYMFTRKNFNKDIYSEALSAAAARYATGEISEEDFKKIKKELKN